MGFEVNNRSWIINPGGLRKKTAEAQSAREDERTETTLDQKKNTPFFLSACNKVNFTALRTLRLHMKNS
jgi:hypothetical protein